MYCGLPVRNALAVREVLVPPVTGVRRQGCGALRLEDDGSVARGRGQRLADHLELHRAPGHGQQQGGGLRGGVGLGLGLRLGLGLGLRPGLTQFSAATTSMDSLPK